MKIYLDVSCLNRPFDDRGQERIRLEAEAINIIPEQMDAGRWRHLSSQMTEIEIEAIPDIERRRRIRFLLPRKDDKIQLDGGMFSRAAELEKIGLKPADAVHVAAAEALGVDLFLSCDDRLCRIAQKRRNQIRVRVANPLLWLQEVQNAQNS